MGTMKLIITSLFLFFSFYLFAQKSSFQSLVEQKKYVELKEYLTNQQEPSSIENKEMLFKHILSSKEKEVLVLYEALGRELFFKLINIRQVTNNKAELLTYSNHLAFILGQKKQEQEWSEWAYLIKNIAEVAYFENNTSKAGKYYHLLEEHIAKADTVCQIVVRVVAANHFMGVEQNYEKAEQFFFRTLSLSQEKSLPFTLTVYGSLAELYFRKKDYERSLDFSYKIMESPKVSVVQKVDVQLKVAQILQIKGAYSKAKEELNKIEKIISSVDPMVIAQNPFWNRLVGLYYAQSLETDLQVEDIETIAAKKEKIIKEIIPSTHNPFAKIKLETALLKACTILQDTETDNIEHFIIQNANYPTSVLLPHYLAVANFYYQKNELDKAIEYYDIILETSSSKNKAEELKTYPINGPLAFEALVYKIKILQKRSTSVDKTTLKRQYLYLKEAIVLLDYLRQTQFTTSAKLEILKETDWLYQTALAVVYDLYQQEKKETYLNEIYRLIEKSKSILLADILMDEKAKKNSTIPLVDQEKEKALLRDLSIYEAQLYEAKQKNDSLKIKTLSTIVFDTRNEVNILKKVLEQKYPKYIQYTQQNSIVPLPKVKDELEKQGASFISYFVREKEVYIFSIVNGISKIRKIVFPKQDARNLVDITLDIRKFLSDFNAIVEISEEDYMNYLSKANLLFELLLSDELSGNPSSRLIISPDGILNYIPFEVLLMKKEALEDMDYTTLAYLIKTYKISYHYTTSLWYLSSQNKNFGGHSNQILGMSATYPAHGSKVNTEWGKVRQQLGELQGANNEVTYLKNNFEGTYYLGAAATENQFRKTAKNHGIIHLALHGVVNEKQPMSSGLIFSDDADSLNDNVLQAYEIQATELNANLVVLSACSTGEGVYKKGEGVISLGRSFLYAGTPCVVVSLWQLNDMASELMIRLFYENLEKGMSKDEALQQAKLSYLERTEGIASHPAFWSPMILIGDNAAIDLSAKNSYWWLWGVLLLGLLGAILFLLKNKFQKQE